MPLIGEFPSINGIIAALRQSIRHFSSNKFGKITFNHYFCTNNGVQKAKTVATGYMTDATGYLTDADPPPIILSLILTQPRQR